jgi:hypothetical protein
VHARIFERIFASLLGERITIGSIGSRGIIPPERGAQVTRRPGTQKYSLRGHAA